MACLILSPAAFAQEVFWAAPESDTVQLSTTNEAGQTLALSTSGAIEYQRDFVSPDQLGRVSSVSLSQALTGSSTFNLSHARATQQKNTVLGFTQNNLSVSYIRGRGEDYSEIRGQYAGIDPYQFHSGIDQRYQFDGYAVDYQFDGIGNLQYGQATLQADGLLDRKAQYFQWANRSAYARVSEFTRGGQQIGHGYDFGFALGNRAELGFQAIELDSDRSLQRLRLQFDGRKSRQYWLDVSSHRNALFRDNDDVSVMFTFKTRLGGGSSLVSYSNETTEGAGGAAPVKKKRSGFNKSLLLIGAGVVAAAGLSSSGSDGQDAVVRFRSQRDAAFDVLNGINPTSIRENREYGGWVFVNADGSFSSTSPVRGEAASVRLPRRSIVIPVGGRATATYHTHAAFDPRFDNENFSPQDLESDRQLGVDGYLGTPGGQFKFHNVATGAIQTLGRLATN